MATEDLQLDITDRVATMTFNRPDRLNALSPDMLSLAISTLERWAVDPDIGAIVLTGAGRGFCAGGDVQVMSTGAKKAETLEGQIDVQRGVHRFSGLLYSIPKICIAAINGPAAGAGMAISLACDLRIMSDAAMMTTAFARVGFAGDFGITWPLVRTLGEGKAKELLLLSEKLSADDAKSLGLVNMVAPADEFPTQVRELALRIASGPQIAYRYMKENARLASQQSYQDLLDREGFSQIRSGATEDHKEGAMAFVEKRAPVFKGL